MTMEESDKIGKKSIGKLSIWHDLYVDLLGGMVPGLLTVILGGSVVTLTLFTIDVAKFQNPMGFFDFVRQGHLHVLVETHWEFDAAVLVLAYIIGTVFFRQDPKNPDRASALHVWMHSNFKERQGLAVQSKGCPEDDFFEPGDATDPGPGKGRAMLRHRLLSLIRRKHYYNLLKLDTQFPYSHLRCYLVARSLGHLLDFVRWCPKESESEKHRTKMFINILKIRLLGLYPEISRDIIRNEAHVRLATSVWYAFSILVILSFTSFVIVVGADCYVAFINKAKTDNLFMPTTTIVLLLAFCGMVRMHLRKCIHYMRVREVVYVLETANLAKRTFGPDLFDDLLPESDVCKCSSCLLTGQCNGPAIPEGKS